MTELLKNRLNTFCLLFLLVVGPAKLWASSEFPPAYQDFIEVSQRFNNHFSIPHLVANTPAQYLPSSQKVFDLPYAVVPLSKLHWVDSEIASKGLRDNVLLVRNGERCVRFFIHPQSLNLYANLIKQFPLEGTYRATPMASTRTLAVIRPDDPSAKPFFVKVSLDAEQFGMGRAVPDWEIRKSVGISRQLVETPAAKWEAEHTMVISEPMGGYVDKSLHSGSYIDQNQGTIFQHGLIFREAEWIEQVKPTERIMPAYAFFSERPNGKGGFDEPLFLEYWRKSNLPFEKYLKSYILEPIVDSSGYLIFDEGILPEMHGQNFEIVIDRETGKISRTLHHDIGSMKVDLRSRWMHGKNNAWLKSEAAIKDYKFFRATELYDAPFFGWLEPYLFSNRFGQEQMILKYFPDYPKNAARTILDTLTSDQVRKRWGIKLKYLNHLGWPDQLSKIAERRLIEFQPKLNIQAVPTFSKVALQDWIDQQHKMGATAPFSPWSKIASTLPEGQIAVTDFGVLYNAPNQGLSLAYFNTFESEADFKHRLAGQGPLPINRSPFQKQSVLEKTSFFLKCLKPFQSLFTR